MTLTKARKWLVEYFESKHGMNRTQLAKALGISQPAVSGWVRGISRPEDALRRALERLIGLPADWWLTRAERITAFGRPSMQKTGTEG